MCKLNDRNPNNKECKFIKDVAYVNGSFYCAVFIVAHQQWHMMTKRSLRLASRPEQMNWLNLMKGFYWQFVTRSKVMMMNISTIFTGLICYDKNGQE